MNRSIFAVSIIIIGSLAPAAGQASQGNTVALGKVQRQYYLELLASACVTRGLLDPKVVVAMQKSEVRLEAMLSPGTNVTAAKAKVNTSTAKSIASGSLGAKLFCAGLEKEIVP
jgi:hypothetical protein